MEATPGPGGQLTPQRTLGMLTSIPGAHWPIARKQNPNPTPKPALPWGHQYVPQMHLLGRSQGSLIPRQFSIFKRSELRARETRRRFHRTQSRKQSWHLAPSVPEEGLNAFLNRLGIRKAELILGGIFLVIKNSRGLSTLNLHEFDNAQ